MANYATMGYVGFVKFGNMVVRATSCDVKTSQEITFPEVVDGKADTTLYQMGPKVTGGSVAFPLVHDTATGTCLNEGSTPNLASNSIIAALWRLAVLRDSQGKLSAFDTNVRYYSSLSYVYPKCLINSISLTVAQQGAIEMSVDLWGGAVSGNGTDRETPIGATDASSVFNALNYLSPARIATWNDFKVFLFGIGSTSTEVNSSELREFSVTMNNNLERFYTLNGSLSAFDIAAKKREISGTLKIIGHNQALTNYAEQNEQRFTSDAQIAFGTKIGGPAQSPYWATALNGVIFEIEEVAISTGLFETSTKWRATGDCNTNYDATYLGKTRSLAYDLGTTSYGAKTFATPQYDG